jgi:hypothetical protein
MSLTERRRLIERIRVYHRQNDLLQGYLPQLAMPERSSEWWCLLWYCIRQLDTLVDASPQTSEVGDPLARLRSLDPDFERALTLFLEETAGLVPRRLLQQMYASTKMERQYFSDGHPPGVAHYLTLLDRKAGVPVHICALLNGMDGESEVVQCFTRSVGRTAQLMDDLLDLYVDMAKGQLFITQEELSLLGLSPADLFAHLDWVANLRNQWILQSSWAAYETAHELRDNPFALVARSWIEGIWKLIANGKSMPLNPILFRRDRDFAHYMGVTPLPFDLFPGSELLKYRWMHPIMVTFLKHYSVFEYGRAKQLAAQIDGPIAPLLDKIAAAQLELQTPLKAQTSDPQRTLIDMDADLELSALTQAAPQIARKAIADWHQGVTSKLNRGEVSGVMVDLLSEPINLQHVADQMGLEQTHNFIIDLLPSDQLRLRGLVDLGFDCLSIIRDHQFAFQKEVLHWLETNSTNK